MQAGSVPVSQQVRPRVSGQGPRRGRSQGPRRGRSQGPRRGRGQGSRRGRGQGSRRGRGRRRAPRPARPRPAGDRRATRPHSRLHRFTHRRGLARPRRRRGLGRRAARPVASAPGSRTPGAPPRWKSSVAAPRARPEPRPTLNLRSARRRCRGARLEPARSRAPTGLKTYSDALLRPISALFVAALLTLLPVALRCSLLRWPTSARSCASRYGFQTDRRSSSIDAQ